MSSLVTLVTLVSIDHRISPNDRTITLLLNGEYWPKADIFTPSNNMML